MPTKTVNLVYGRTDNPYDVYRTVGGSSGGEAALIATCCSPLGLGNDMGSSLRLPAHYCGLAALKPTNGRIPNTGIFPPMGSTPVGTTAQLMSVGPMARRVEDLWLAFSVLTGTDNKDPNVVEMPIGAPSEVKLSDLRVAYYLTNGVFAPSLETLSAVNQAAQTLGELGLSVENVCPPAIEELKEDVIALYGNLIDCGGLLAGAVRRLSSQQHPVTDVTLEICKSHSSSTAAEYGTALIKRDRFRSAMLEFMSQYDVVISPVAATQAPKHNYTLDATSWAKHLSYSFYENLSGFPAVTVRVGTSAEGLPIGVQVVARPWQEEVAIAVALQLQKDSWPLPCED